MNKLIHPFLRFNKLGLLLIASLAANLAHADICADLRVIQSQSKSHFDGWKKESVEEGARRQFSSSFVLDGATRCVIGGNSTHYSCVWQLASPTELRSAYARMVEQVKACPPLGKELPAILNDQPEERTRDGVRQTMEITGFDFADAEVTVLVGRLEVSGGKPAQTSNQLRFSFARSGSSPR
ncbi:vesicle formation protein [Herbaspirillum sp. alder98]|uniref:vesicle formation protein n=1 Tax=Herbaspirillum sp. alder98 TaxID=2913096 RepID=UPI001CD8C0A6|nr:vesicle formation protein [Herbaspirillum sp. alder98]MCA1327115.1 vesicle formation protein [Herbaspirillum sp. alder98]